MKQLNIFIPFGAHELKHFSRKIYLWKLSKPFLSHISSYILQNYNIAATKMFQKNDKTLLNI